MNKTERLIDIISTTAYFPVDGVIATIGSRINPRFIEAIADQLIANGVIVLPCQKGATLMCNGEECVADHWNIVLTAFSKQGYVRVFDVEQAEQALREERTSEPHTEWQRRMLRTFGGDADV